MGKKTPNKTKFPHEVIETSIQDQKDLPVFVRDSMVENLGLDEEDILEITEEDLNDGNI